MNDSYLHFTASRLQAAELDRRAQRLGPQLAALSDRAPTPLHDPVTVRFAAPDDQRELKRLADLDSASLPADPLLIGERAGQPIAALSLVDHAVVANPFVVSDDVVAMLRLRALQLRRVHPGGRRLRGRRLTVLRLRLLRDADL